MSIAGANLKHRPKILTDMFEHQFHFAPPYKILPALRGLCVLANFGLREKEFLHIKDIGKI